jgi:DNA-directed RNA polymerase specialized sigma24 family protein
MQWNGVHALIDRAKRGDQSAWHELFGMVQPFLLRVAGQLLGPNWPEKSVSDLFQDTWMRAFPKLSEFRGGENDAQTGAAFRAWLAQIMRNVHRNIVRADGTTARRTQSCLIRPDALRGDGSHSGDAWSEISSGEPTPSVQLRMQERNNVSVVPSSAPCTPATATCQSWGPTEHDARREFRCHTGFEPHVVLPHPRGDG